MPSVSKSTFRGSIETGQQVDSGVCEDWVHVEQHATKRCQLFPIVTLRHRREQAARLRGTKAQAHRIFRPDLCGCFFRTAYSQLSVPLTDHLTSWIFQATHAWPSLGIMEHPEKILARSAPNTRVAEAKARDKKNMIDRDKPVEDVRRKWGFGVAPAYRVFSTSRTLRVRQTSCRSRASRCVRSFQFELPFRPVEIRAAPAAAQR